MERDAVSFLRDVAASCDLSSAGDELRAYAVDLASRCPYRPLRSRAIVAEVPERYPLSASGLYLPSRRGRICKTGLIVSAHPQWYSSTKCRGIRTLLSVGDLVVFIKIAIKPLAYDSVGESWLYSVRQEDIDAILNWPG